MKKFLLLIVILPLLSTNLHTQTEVVIESFDNWIGGLPEGYEWGSDTLNSAISEITGQSGSALKIIDLNGPIHNGGVLRRNIFFTRTTIPDSLAYYFKGSSPGIEEGTIGVQFIDGVVTVGTRIISIFSGTNWQRLCGGFEFSGVFDKIEIRIDVYQNPSYNNEWGGCDEITLIQHILEGVAS